MNDLNTPETRGATLSLALTLTTTGAAIPAALLGALSVYGSVKAQRSPLGDLRSFIAYILKNLQTIADAESEVLTYPATVISGALAKQSQVPLFQVAKSGQKLDATWLKTIAGRANIGVLGDQGEGKSFILRYLVYRFIQRHRSNCRIYIHDIEGGLGHGENIEWFGLPQGSVVFTDPDDLPRLLAQLQTSIDAPDFIPTLLVVDEFNNCIDELGEDQRSAVDKALKQIRNRGKKRQICFAFGTHDINVPDLGLSKAAIKKLDWIVLPKMAGGKDNFRNLDLSPDAQNERQSAYEQMAHLEPTNGIYPCLLYQNRHFALKRIPDLSGLPKTLELSVESNPEKWWAGFRTEHPEFNIESYQSLRQLTDAINNKLRQKNAPQIKRSGDDPRYALLKTLISRTSSQNHGEPSLSAVVQNQNQLSRTSEPRRTKPLGDFEPEPANHGEPRVTAPTVLPPEPTQTTPSTLENASEPWQRLLDNFSF